MKRAALYICYYQVSEPLVQSQVIAYLRELAASGIEMHLLTFERERLTAEQERNMRTSLAQAGITWYKLRYHQRPSLLATLYDIIVGAMKALLICRKHKIQLIHARSHVPAMMALMFKRLLGYRFLFDMRGLLAEEYVDGGNWTAGELKYRLTKGMERAFFREADAFIMLTERIKHELGTSEPELAERMTEIKVIPCCVDTSRFSGSTEDRSAYRAARGWIDRRVITYVGKLGMWYLPDEMARFFALAYQHDARFFFQVLTQDDPLLMQRALQASGVPMDAYDIRFVPPSQLSEVLIASDVGISFIRASYSKRASSPTKIGEYLAAGLPVIINTGIGDCDQMMKTQRLGIVLKDFSHNEYRRAADELGQLLDDPDIVGRCRAFAEQELSLTKVGGPRYTAVYERLFALQQATTEANAEVVASAPNG